MKTAAAVVLMQQWSEFGGWKRIGLRHLTGEMGSGRHDGEAAALMVAIDLDKVVRCQLPPAVKGTVTLVAHLFMMILLSRRERRSTAVSPGGLS
ncbi:unnamed protein product [Lactuca virosa]|uniref:Uncharacterized protein n=1 Tax=Lactuca virosa TaxID=75947 RepID=A0AAU9PS73_9ASTR|nr:unnamed protein product [Lactuca virosa]